MLPQKEDPIGCGSLVVENSCWTISTLDNQYIGQSVHWTISMLDNQYVGRYNPYWTISISMLFSICHLLLSLYFCHHSSVFYHYCLTLMIDVDPNIYTNSLASVSYSDHPHSSVHLTGLTII